MTKLQSILSQIQQLPLTEQEEVASLLSLRFPQITDEFNLTDVQLAELDKRLALVDSEPTFAVDEALAKFVS